MKKPAAGRANSTLISYCESSHRSGSVSTPSIKASSPVLKRDGFPNTARFPILRLRDALVRRWKGSTARIVADEIRRFPRRISAILQDTTLRAGDRPIVDHPWDEDWFPWNPSDKYLTDSTQDMQELLKEAPWAGNLDWAFAAKAYRLGGAWSYRNCTERPNKERQP